VPVNQQVKTMDCGAAGLGAGNANRSRCGVAAGHVGAARTSRVGSTTRIDTSGNRNVVKYAN
jgi:hypothetical protein